MLLQEEKQRVDTISRILGEQFYHAFDKIEENDLMTVYKSLANVATTLSSEIQVGAFTYRDTESLSKGEVERAISNLLVQLIQTGAHTEIVGDNRLYKTSDFAQAMGVTQATVSNWIKSSRLVGVEKGGKGKHAMIPDSAEYYSITRQKFVVQEIMESYEKSIQDYRKLPKETPKESYKKLNEYYTKKYKGTYFDTLAMKKELNSQEQRDKTEWEFILEEMGLLHGR